MLLAGEDAKAALVALRQAWKAWQEIEAPYEAARARLLDRARVPRAWRHRRAEMEFDAARWVFQQLEALPDLARVEALSRLDQTKPAGGLTGRELQVLRLVAAGKTNRAIGAELFISERTVERHLSNIFTKLDVSLGRPPLPTRTNTSSSDRVGGNPHVISAMRVGGATDAPSVLGLYRWLTGRLAAPARRPAWTDTFRRISKSMRGRSRAIGASSFRHSRCRDRMQLAGTSTSVLIGGTGPSIVLLHGPGEFAGKWLRVLPSLLTTHRVVAPDLPCHGNSDAIDGARHDRAGTRLARRAD